MKLYRVKSMPKAGILVLESMRIQLLLAILIAVGLPILLIGVDNYLNDPITMRGIMNSTVVGLVAVVLAIVMFRQVTSFPGIRAFRFVLPTYAGAYGIVLAVIVALRIDYNRPMLALSFAFALIMALGINFYLLRRGVRRFYIVPFGRYEIAFHSPNTDWVVMEKPEIPNEIDAVIVADLHFDHEQEWEQMLAHAAVAGHPVYHIKQLRESLTGRVSIEHISENSFGSMLPNLAYRKVKRSIDLAAALALLPILGLPLLLVGLLIKLDSPGPALFRQQRMGYRGKPFSIFKFRTMGVQDEQIDNSRGAAMTEANDPRITKLGNFLRRSRIDELPQIFNVVAGDMSWIGPRPEATALSVWYEKEIPFYFYRHIVRPGITGWAQVNQGHVSDLDSVSTKLGYDFYYIKNFSLWLDVLIALRTVSTMLSGFGAR